MTKKDFIMHYIVRNVITANQMPADKLKESIDYYERAAIKGWGLLPEYLKISTSETEDKLTQQ